MLTVQSVSDARLAPVTRQGSPRERLVEPLWTRAVRPALGRGRRRQRRPGEVGAHPRSAGARVERRTARSRWSTAAAAEVLGRPTYPTLAEARAAGEHVDLVVLCVPSAGAASTPSRDAVAAGARALVVITAGLSELGEEGARAGARGGRRSRARRVWCWSARTASASSTPAPSLQLSHAVLPPGDVDRAQPERQRGARPRRACSPTAVWASRGSSPWATRPTSRVVDLMQSLPRRTTARVRSRCTPRTWSTAARSSPRPAPWSTAGKPVVLLAPGRSEAAVRGARSRTPGR